MPRIRTVKPDLWHDEAIGEVSLEARLTFVGLITQADDEGRQKGDPRLIRSLVFPYDSVDAPEVSGWLAELSDKGLIVRYEVGGKEFIELPSWGRHQRVSHPTASALPSQKDALPENSGAAPEDSPLRGREGRGEEGKGGELNSPSPRAEGCFSREICDLLQRGIDSLGDNDNGRPWPSPRPEAIDAVVAGYDPEVVRIAARETREIVQSQDRAPNVTALFKQKLSEHPTINEEIREALS